MIDRKSWHWHRWWKVLLTAVSISHALLFLFHNLFEFNICKRQEWQTRWKKERDGQRLTVKICGSQRITGSWIPRSPLKEFWWHLHVGSFSFIFSSFFISSTFSSSATSFFTFMNLKQTKCWKLWKWNWKKKKTTDSLLERKENYKEMKHGGCQVNGPKVAKFLDR